MDHLDFEALSEGLVDCETPLEEWDRLAVRDYWSTVVADELGALEPAVAPLDWSDLGSSERVRVRRYQRRLGNTVLRLVATSAEVRSVTGTTTEHCDVMGEVA